MWKVASTPCGQHLSSPLRSPGTWQTLHSTNQTSWWACVVLGVAKRTAGKDTSSRFKAFPCWMQSYLIVTCIGNSSKLCSSFRVIAETWGIVYSGVTSQNLQLGTQNFSTRSAPFDVRIPCDYPDSAFIASWIWHPRNRCSFVWSRAAFLACVHSTAFWWENKNTNKDIDNAMGLIS